MSKDNNKNEQENDFSEILEMKTKLHRHDSLDLEAANVKGHNNGHGSKVLFIFLDSISLP